MPQYIRVAYVPPMTNILEDIKVVYLRAEGETLVTTVHVPLSRIFSSTNFTIFVGDNDGRTASINLCSNR